MGRSSTAQDLLVPVCHLECRKGFNTRTRIVYVDPAKIDRGRFPGDFTDSVSVVEEVDVVKCPESSFDRRVEEGKTL